jgi:hypothetical protein
VPGLEAFKASLEEIYDDFNKYKRTVPVRCVCAWLSCGGCMRCFRDPRLQAVGSRHPGWLRAATDKLETSASGSRTAPPSGVIARPALGSAARASLLTPAAACAAAGRGAILLSPDMSKVLLVRGYKRDAGWGFPRGKLSKGESDAECAVREVLEETGLDIGASLREGDFIDAQLRDQDTRLFIVQARAARPARRP